MSLVEIYRAVLLDGQELYQQRSRQLLRATLHYLRYPSLMSHELAEGVLSEQAGVE